MVICPYCHQEARLVSGKDVYPNHANLHEKAFWKCSPCRAWVGCHPGTFIPLGVLADRELRQKRQEAHQAFDRMWKPHVVPGRKSAVRNRAYRWLAKAIGIPYGQCHIGMMDMEQCRQVIRVCLERELFPRKARFKARENATSV